MRRCAVTRRLIPLPSTRLASHDAIYSLSGNYATGSPLGIPSLPSRSTSAVWGALALHASRFTLSATVVVAMCACAGLLQQAKLFAVSRHVPGPLTRSFERFVETQWMKTAGLDNSEVLGRTMKLPTRFHDEILISVFDLLIPSCPLLSSAQTLPGAGALPPLLRLLSLQVVLQKQLLIGENHPCSEIYILVKGSLQAQLSQQGRTHLEQTHVGTVYSRRGGGDLLSTRQDAAMPSCANQAEFAAAVAAAASIPSQRDTLVVPKGAKTIGAFGGDPEMVSTSPPAALEGLGAVNRPARREVCPERSPAPSAASSSAMAREMTNKPIRTRTGANKRNWKANLMSRHILEREGSMVGIADPLGGKSKVSPFLVTALKQSDVLVLNQAPLKAIVNLLPRDDAHIICAVVQAQYNHVLEALKAKELIEDSVEKRREDHEKCTRH